jgi:UDP-N-acetylmuramoyl-tripeptide--D-alanyl-D-alanine ligase
MNQDLSSWLSGAQGYTSDSRKIAPGHVFVALRGERSDGHDFIPALLGDSRVQGFVVSREVFEKHRAEWTQRRPAEEFFTSEDPHAVHREIAAYFRAKFKGLVIAVGGSSGKTSCKEFLAQILQRIGKKCVATYKSQNGELGIPKTLEALSSGVEVAVIEIGIDGPGDMDRHIKIVRPDVAILTSIGEEHLNLLKNLEGVFAEERILFDKTLERGGRCFAPASDAWLAKIPGIQRTPDDPQQLDPLFHSNLQGIFPKRNAALAAAVCLNVYPSDKAKIAQALQSLEIPEGRGRVVSDAHGRIWVEDHYNSNPSSLKASLLQAQVLKRERQKPITLVLGDMLDLGRESAQLHESVVPSIRDCAPQRVVLIGPFMGALKKQIANLGCEIEIFENSELAARHGQFKEWGKSITVFKGSRGMALEKTLKAFQNSEAP